MHGEKSHDPATDHPSPGPRSVMDGDGSSPGVWYQQVWPGRRHKRVCEVLGKSQDPGSVFAQIQGVDTVLGPYAQALQSVMGPALPPRDGRPE